MKKRVKLLTTIASLCLAVALMAFGVYAASNATYGVTTNVTFGVGDNLAGTITVTAYADADGAKQDTAPQGALSNNTTVILASDENSSTTTPANTIALTGNIALSPEERYVVYVIDFVKTENSGSKDATITVSDIKIGGVALASATDWEASTTLASGSAVNTFTFFVKYTAEAAISTASVVSFNVTFESYTPAAQG